MTDQLRVKVSQATPALKKLVRVGGSAVIRVGDEYRAFQQVKTQRPLVHLPWPLSKIQRSYFTITYSTFDKWTELMPSLKIAEPGANHIQLGQETYDDAQLEQGIERFLKGAAPTDEIDIVYGIPW